MESASRIFSLQSNFFLLISSETYIRRFTIFLLNIKEDLHSPVPYIHHRITVVTNWKIYQVYLYALNVYECYHSFQRKKCICITFKYRLNDQPINVLVYWYTIVHRCSLPNIMYLTLNNK